MASRLFMCSYVCFALPSFVTISLGEEGAGHLASHLVIGSGCDHLTSGRERASNLASRCFIGSGCDHLTWERGSCSLTLLVVKILFRQ